MTHQDPLPHELRNALEVHYSFRLDAPTPLLGGEEALIWQVSSSLGPLVVRMSPAHRSPARLQQIHQVLLALAPVLPPILAPRPAPDGSTLLSYHGQAVELFPFVSGERLDREDARLRGCWHRCIQHSCLRHSMLLPWRARAWWENGSRKLRLILLACRIPIWIAGTVRCESKEQRSRGLLPSKLAHARGADCGPAGLGRSASRFPDARSCLGELGVWQNSLLR